MASNLLSLARQFQVDHAFLASPAEAQGRCLWACLVFACIAKQYGHDLRLARWAVANGRYTDHWGICFSYDEVIDFTRAQVDGIQGVLFSVADYPPTYHTRRTYPASIFLNGDFNPYRFSKPDSQFSENFQLDVQLAIVRYDLQHRREKFGWKEWGIVLFSAAVFGWCLMNMG